MLKMEDGEEGVRGGHVIYLLICALTYLWNLQRLPGLSLWRRLHFLFLVRLLAPRHHHHGLFVLPQGSGAQEVRRSLRIGRATLTKRVGRGRRRKKGKCLCDLGLGNGSGGQ